jgi:hypothetical protein
VTEEPEFLKKYVRGTPPSTETSDCSSSQRRDSNVHSLSTHDVIGKHLRQFYRKKAD